MATMTKMTSRDQLQAAIERTSDRALLLFKHSTRCPISAAAYDQVLAYLKGEPQEGFEYMMIDVIADRAVSNEAAERLGVRHESPQVIVVQDGQPVWHTSHYQITAGELDSKLKSL
ncbi:bacillithiol system redox-active protein YtxJ [Paenibacillus sp. F411]|uniref:General stress protein n=1 Tax=Paenibacillus algicola TaxID=2565926 RepID=A0A4P8XL11_9BACL|nr:MULTISPECIES: bacillithiol system redox-active protein YtxJ [Paenibacillus]MBO2944937.1 bacillithiol system redox-active protein YtxJ [Paenibacillus sp. F411]QCT02330.1 general stress protein [Paenibacillus algicola]